MNRPDTHEIHTRFDYHKPTMGQQHRMEVLRENARSMALSIIGSTPASREQSLSLTHLEQALFYAIAAIARRDTLMEGER